MAPPLRTLLVDDVEDIRALLRFLFSRDERFRVVAEAADGSEAIALAAEHQPDVIVLDLAMPVMDGLTALPRLREVAPHAKVVVLSGFPADQMGTAAERAGAVGYLEKGGDVHGVAEDVHELVLVLGVVGAVLERALPPEPASAGRAREAVTTALITEVGDAALDVLVLLTSELVTNVVAHARTTCHLGVELLRDVVRVTVSDDVPTPPAPRVASSSAESGRGLELVEALSSDWGIVTRDEGKTIWFEVARATR